MIEISSLKDIDKAAIEFIDKIRENKIFAFIGEMGVGKTTLIKSICEKLGVIENVNSPTFSIVNEYTTKTNKIIYHFDCYRLKNIEEALEIGIEEYLYSGNLCFIEWPDKIASLLPDNLIEVNIKELENGKRIVYLKEKKWKERKNS